MADKKSLKNMISTGSALILAVVLTTLLAIVGVLFVLVARVDKIATSAISENRELNWAADSVIAKISQELVLDVPGVDPNVNVDYYDYPGPEDRWLASLEPYQFGAGDYRWRQTSDVYDRLDANALDLRAEIIDDYQPNIAEDVKADADGDGVADSRWVVIPDVNSSKGRPIYAAIRVIDNGGMMNVNTAYKFDPNGPRGVIDGSSQLQINLMALANRPGRPITPPGKDEVALLAERADYRFGNNKADLPKYETDLAAYEPDVIWRYGSPVGAYTPFDVGDELELRYRFLVNHEDILTRIERIWTWSFNSPTELNTPISLGGAKNITDWFKRAYDNDSGSIDPNYSYRHIATTCNMDRIIDPDGAKMVNVNMADANSIYDVIRKVLPGTLAAQIAVNIKDYRDPDSDVTTYGGYYGFETPCIYISELAHNFVPSGSSTDPNHHSYAIELYKPYPEDSVPSNKWQLKFPKLGTFPINWHDPNQFHVAVWEDLPSAPLPVNSTASSQKASLAGGAVIFDSGDLIELQRKVIEPNGAPAYITVDSIQVPVGLVSGQGLHSFHRDITKHKCIRRLWDDANSPTLGWDNSFVNPDPNEVQAHPANKPFTNIGEIGMIFRNSAYNVPVGVTEPGIRLDLADSAFQQIFNYLTVFDPAVYFWNDPNETKVKGRININTAPWFVIAQLPWVSAGTPNNELAHAIVAYRDKLTLNSNVDYHTDNWGNGKTRKQGMGLKSTDPDVREVPGFAYIDELLNVTQQVLSPMANEPLYDIRRYGRDNLDLFTFPDLTVPDGATDDFEERDLIFSRISNLISVRSDVFTAYILIRIGPNGPQRRVIAILDRSGVYSRDGKVKIIALQPVPDPR